ANAIREVAALHLLLGIVDDPDVFAVGIRHADDGTQAVELAEPLGAVAGVEDHHPAEVSLHSIVLQRSILAAPRFVAGARADSLVLAATLAATALSLASRERPQFTSGL